MMVKTEYARSLVPSHDPVDDGDVFPSDIIYNCVPTH